MKPTRESKKAPSAESIARREPPGGGQGGGMRDLLRNEVPANCKHVVLAMTEFSPVVRHLRSRGRRSKILIDPVDIYAEAIAREYLGLPALS